MAIGNCARCGALISAAGKKLCPSCSRERDEQFSQVRDYVSRYPNAGLPEVSRETEVPEKEVLRFLREGRLVSKSLALSTLKCRRCGEAIEKGRLCPRCASDLAGSLGGPAAPRRPRAQPTEDPQRPAPERKPSPLGRSRMHTLDRLRKRRT